MLEAASHKSDVFSVTFLALLKPSKQDELDMMSTAWEVGTNS